MPTVTNQQHRELGVAARKAWAKVKGRQPATDYPLECKGQRLVGWTHITAPIAVLHTMHVVMVGDLPTVTYMQVRHDGATVRSMTRPAKMADLERWFHTYPDDRKTMYGKIAA